MEPVIHIENLTFTYQNGTPALAEVNLTVASGETVVFIGPNGAGKTTLFLYILGLLNPIPREVTVLGRPLTDPATVEAVRGQVGLVFQNPDDQLFCTTVFDDVAFGPINQGLAPAVVQARVEGALTAVGLAGYEDRVPHHLSGGEKRRLGLATIYAMTPEVMLLDEPTSHLDPRGRQEVIRLLKAFPGTKLVATHDFELALEVATRVVLLHKGRIRADGPPLTILTDEGLLKSSGLEMPLVLQYFVKLRRGVGDHRRDACGY
jgi:cobalt/nickel transport system ATP-binding protein